MTTKCIIDIGSNTIKLFIAELKSNGEIIPLETKRRMALLGKGIHKTKKLPTDSKQLAIKYIEEYLDICTKYNVEPSNILITATAACRNASDGTEFIKYLKDKFNLLNIKILTEEEEIKYTFLGVLESIQTNCNALYYILDVGGGSFQLSLGTETDFINGISIQIGCNNATEEFALNQIVSNDQLYKAINYFKNIEIKDFEIPDKPTKLIGTGGTIKIVQLMTRNVDNFNPIKLDELFSIANFLASKNIEERLNWFKTKYPDETFRIDSGLTEDRAKVLLAGVCIIIGIAEKLQATEVILSKTDAKNYVIKF